MVRRLAAILPALAVALALCLALAPGAAAQEEPDDQIATDEYDVMENARLSVSPVGNVIHKDELVYDREFFDAQSANFEEYPFLLSRRYRAMEAVNEVQDFRADLDKEAATVTLTFREPGRAYNMGDYWIMYGFYTEPKDLQGREMVFEEESTVNSDYTLWQDLDFKTTTVVSFPQGSAAIHWDETDSAVVWEMPAQLAALEADPGNALQQNQAVFITLFAVLMAGSLGTVVVVLARGRRTAATVAGAAAAATTLPTATPVDTPPVEAAPSAPEAPLAETAATDEAEETGATEEKPHFCRYCGLHLPDGDVRFCPGCGKDLGHRD